MIKQPLRLALAGAALAAVTSVVVAATPDQTIAARQAAFKAIGKANKGLRDELQKPQPSVAVLQANATVLATTAVRVGSLFPAGTGPGGASKTQALPAIWANVPDFQAKHLQFVGAARQVQAAARAGNVDQVKAAVGRLGGTCKACHDDYRGKD